MRLEDCKRFNPLYWSRRMVKRALLVFYAVTVPIYLYIGFQPANATVFTSVATTSSSRSAGLVTTDISTSIPDTDSFGTLSIPSIALSTAVQPLHLTTEHTLDTPDTIAGSYAPYTNKTLLIGHSSTVFQALPEVRIGDSIIYNNKAYHIIRREVATKENINMYRLIKAEKDDLLVLMTCAGQPLGQRDATHRLLITAIEDKP